MRNKRQDEPPRMELNEIREIIELMKEHDLSVFHLERDGIKLKLKKGMDLEEIAAAAPKALPEYSVAAPEPPAPAESETPSAQESSNNAEINSPMVGTFYRSPSPESDPFVKVGDNVDEETTVCIIEAMKVMNEIKADINGIIERVLVDDSTPVQYGEPLFVVSPA